MSKFLQHGESLLGNLPAKPHRDERQRREAEGIRRACHTARARFLQAHVEALYEELTDGRRRFLRIDELAFAAAQRHPGLVPDRFQIEQERANIQADKEGREIEQGLFFWSVLSLPVAGAHLVQAMLRPTSQALAALPDFHRTGTADFGQVTVERRGDVAHLIYNNSRFLNAEDDASVDALETAVDLFLLADEIRVGVLRGAPMNHPRYRGQRVFSAGINLTHLYHGQISLLDFFLRRELGYLSKAIRGIQTGNHADEEFPHCSEKPWIALVDGFAIGGGTQQLLTFDRVIAAAGTYFVLPALTEGIIPGSANFRLARFTGSRLSRQLVFWGRKIHTDDEDSRLLCDEVVAPERMEAAAEAAVEQFRNPAVVANRRMMHLFEEPVEVFRLYMAEYALEQSRRLYSPDLIENLQRIWISRSKRSTMNRE
jgi:thioesterase DpgC